jgi:hypothetical protein
MKEELLSTEANLQRIAHQLERIANILGKIECAFTPGPTADCVTVLDLLCHIESHLQRLAEN